MIGGKDMIVGYARVSSETQNLDRQIVALTDAGCEKIYQEKKSGASMQNRDELNKMLDCGIRAGDVIVVVDFSRVARNCADLLKIVDMISAKGASLKSLKEGIDTSTDVGKLVLTLLGSIYEFERTSIRERQRMGIEVAKAKGVYRGRTPKKYDVQIFEGLYQQYLEKQITKVEFAKKMNCSRMTLDKWIADRQTA